MVRSYDALLGWISETVDADEVFDRSYSASDEMRGKTPLQRWNTFKDEILSTVQTKWFNDGATPAQTKGLGKALKHLLGDKTDLLMGSRMGLDEHLDSRVFQKAIAGKDFETDYFDPYRKNIESPKRKQPIIPKLLESNVEYREFIEESIEDAIEELPMDWREDARKRVSKPYRPTREGVGLRTESVVSSGGIKYEFSAEEASQIRKDYDLSIDTSLEQRFGGEPHKTLWALGGKRK